MSELNYIQYSFHQIAQWCSKTKTQKWSDCNETKSKHIDWLLGLKCDHRVWFWPWPGPWIFRVKYGICYISTKSGQKVSCKDLPDSDRGDFRCRRAVDSSSYSYVEVEKNDGLVPGHAGPMSVWWYDQPWLLTPNHGHFTFYSIWFALVFKIYEIDEQYNHICNNRPIL